MIGLSAQIEPQFFVQTHKSVYISKKIRKIIRIGRCLPRDDRLFEPEFIPVQAKSVPAMFAK
jgi:hypothetical protein